MIRCDAPLTRAILAAAALQCAAAAAGAPDSTARRPQTLPDSTTVERWRLGNGLRVVAQSIPRAAGIAVTVAYPAGSDADPPRRRGLARLLAEVQMMGPAGEMPERSRAEMESLRPLGWSLVVGRNATRLSEVATRAQLPGVLRQVAARMRGVTVSGAALQSALASVRRDLGAQLFGSVEQSLHYQAREYAAGYEPNAILDLAEARDLERVAPPELQGALRTVFAPSQAVLALAGDLGGLDLHALIQAEFGGVPGAPGPARDSLDGVAGGAPAAPPRDRFHPGFHVAPRNDVDRPVGVLAVEAPALTDTLHPSFFLCMLLIGDFCKQNWSISSAVQSRFSYSILEEPDLVRFYPDVQPDSTDAGALANRLMETLTLLQGMVVPLSEYDDYRRNVLWLLGGPMPRHVAVQVSRDPAALNLVCNHLAARELTGGEAFWSEYRRRFLARGDPRLELWGRYLARPDHQAALLFTPSHK